MILKVKKIDSDIPDPHYAHTNDAGFDLYTRERVVLKPGERAMIPSGMQFEIPDGYVGLVWDKSGLSMKQGIKMLGGVVDAGYRGEVQIGAINLGHEEYVFEKYHKVAQMLIQKVEQPVITVVEVLADSSRGTQGFGSSGK